MLTHPYPRSGTTRSGYIKEIRENNNLIHISSTTSSPWVTDGSVDRSFKTGYTGGIPIKKRRPIVIDIPVRSQPFIGYQCLAHTYIQKNPPGFKTSTGCFRADMDTQDVMLFQLEDEYIYPAILGSYTNYIEVVAMSIIRIHRNHIHFGVHAFSEPSLSYAQQNFEECDNI